MHLRFATIAVLAGLVLGGCSTVAQKPNASVVPEDKVVLIDPEQLEKETIGDRASFYKATPDHVIVGIKDSVSISVEKTDREQDEQHGIELQIWEVTAINMANIGKCVTPAWRLMEFEYISDGPSEQYIRPHSSRVIGQMQQQIWILEGVPVAPPPSGYLVDMRVRNAKTNAYEGEECMFLEREENIIPEEDIIHKDEDIKDY